MTGVVLRSGTWVDLSAFAPGRPPPRFPLEDIWWGMAYAYARRDAPLTVAQRAWLSEKCVKDGAPDSTRRAVLLKYAGVAFGYGSSASDLSDEARRRLFDLQDVLEKRYLALRSAASEEACALGESMEARILNLSPGETTETSEWFPQTILMQPVLEPRAAFLMLTRRAKALGF